MVVDSRRPSVLAEIADNLGVRSRGGVEAETHANILAATVVIDGLGHADDGGSNPVGGEVFGEMGGVCVGVVAARRRRRRGEGRRTSSRRRGSAPRSLIEDDHCRGGGNRPGFGAVRSRRRPGASTVSPRGPSGRRRNRRARSRRKASGETVEHPRGDVVSARGEAAAEEQAEANAATRGDGANALGGGERANLGTEVKLGRVEGLGEDVVVGEDDPAAAAVADIVRGSAAMFRGGECGLVRGDRAGAGSAGAGSGVAEVSSTAYRKNTVSAARHSGRTGSYASRAR